MGFIDKLRMNSIYGGGGFIRPPIRPIRYEDEEVPYALPNPEPTINPLIAFNLQRFSKPNRSEMDTVYQPPINERLARPMTPYQRESLNLRDRSLDISADRAKNNNAIQTDRVAIQRDAQRLREWKAQNPTGQIKAVRGGNYVVINPVTGESQDTGIPTGTLDRETEIELLQEGRLELADTRGNIQSRHISERGNIQSNLTRERGEQSRLTKQTIPGQANRTELPTQARAKYANNAREFIAREPWAAKHITLDSAGNPTIQPYDPKSISRGYTKEVYDRIVEAIYGSPESRTFVDTPNNPNPGVVTESNEPVVMIDPQGNERLIPAHLVAEAEARGAKRKE